MKWVLESDKYSGRIAWLSSPYDITELAMKYLGANPEVFDKKAIIEAEKLLIKQKKHIKVIASDNGQDLLVTGEIDLCVEYSGDIASVKLEDDDLEYTIASNSSARWVDCMVIPKF